LNNKQKLKEIGKELRDHLKLLDQPEMVKMLISMFKIMITKRLITLLVSTKKVRVESL
jgi:hypothetical protein